MLFTYAQRVVTPMYGGVPLVDLSEGSSVKIAIDGGTIEKTEGTDGAALNVGTMQGATAKVTLKETSPSYALLWGQVLAQQSGAPGQPFVLFSGVGVLHTLPIAYVSVPGELSTGDKKMGSVEFTFTSAEYAVGGFPI